MQPIERYGVIALLFIVIAVVTVVAWGGDDTPVPSERGAFLARRGDSGAPAAPPARPARRTSDPGPVERSPVERGPFEKGPVATRSPSGLPLSDGELERGESRSLRAREIEGAAPTRAADAVRDAWRAAGPESAADRREEPRTASRERAGERRSRSDETGRTVRATTPARPSASRDTAPSTGADDTRTYTLRSGDTLSEVAQRKLGRGSRWREIQALNPSLDPLRLTPGTVVRLPAGAAPAAAERAAEAATDAAPGPQPRIGGEYVVRSGDSLWRIAESALGDGERWREIASLNPRTNPNRLTVGGKLLLPEGARASEEARSQVAALEPGSRPRVR